MVVKTEVKNMNSFKGVKQALSFEIERQVSLLNEAKSIIQETRLWYTLAQETLPMRSKEEAQDYRYFPEPDLPPFIIKQEKIEEIRRSIPELPQEKRLRFMKEYGLSEYEAKIIAASKEYAMITEERIREYPGENKKSLVNWAIGPILATAGSLNCGPAELKIPGGNAELIKLVKAVEDGKLSNLSAKAIFSESITTGIPSSTILRDKNLYQVSDEGTLSEVVEEAIEENQKSVGDYKAGKVNALMFLVGQAMKKSKGKANPNTLQQLLKRRLENA